MPPPLNRIDSVAIEELGRNERALILDRDRAFPFLDFSAIAFQELSQFRFVFIGNPGGAVCLAAIERGRFYAFAYFIARSLRWRARDFGVSLRRQRRCSAQRLSDFVMFHKPSRNFTAQILFGHWGRHVGPAADVNPTFLVNEGNSTERTCIERVDSRKGARRNRSREIANDKQRFALGEHNRPGAAVKIYENKSARASLCYKLDGAGNPLVIVKDDRRLDRLLLEQPITCEGKIGSTYLSACTGRKNPCANNRRRKAAHDALFHLIRHPAKKVDRLSENRVFEKGLGVNTDICATIRLKKSRLHRLSQFCDRRRAAAVGLPENNACLVQ